MTSAVELVNRLIELEGRITWEDMRPDNPLADYLLSLARKEMGRDDAAVQACAALTVGLSKSRVYRVQENMTDLVIERAAQLDESLRMGDYPPPRPNGFVYFEDPLEFNEIRGRQQVAYYVTWTYIEAYNESRPDQLHQGWIVSLWGDAFQRTDEVLREIWAQNGPDAQRFHAERFGRWAPITIGWVSRSSRVGPFLLDKHHVQPQARDLVGDRAVANPLRWIAALWQLLSETVPGIERETVEEHVPRSLRKTARNRGFDPDELGVTTVVLRRLRKPTQHPGTGRPQESRLWIEGGYTRTYWVGPKGHQRKVVRVIGGHWSNKDENLPVRNRRVVSELRR